MKDLQFKREILRNNSTMQKHDLPKWFSDFWSWLAQSFSTHDGVRLTIFSSVWNCLPRDIRYIQSITAFKTSLKTHLFKT